MQMSQGVFEIRMRGEILGSFIGGRIHLHFLWFNERVRFFFHYGTFLLDY